MIEPSSATVSRSSGAAVGSGVALLAWYVISSLKQGEAFWVLMGEVGGVGPSDGGCLICARAVCAVFGGAVVHLARDGQPDHYGVYLDGWILDFDGPAGSPECWINRFVTLERVVGHVTFHPFFAPSPDIPDNAAASRALSRLIRARLERMHPGVAPAGSWPIMDT